MYFECYVQTLSKKPSQFDCYGRKSLIDGYTQSFESTFDLLKTYCFWCNLIKRYPIVGSSHTQYPPHNGILDQGACAHSKKLETHVIKSGVPWKKKTFLYYLGPRHMSPFLGWKMKSSVCSFLSHHVACNADGAFSQNFLCHWKTDMLNQIYDYLNLKLFTYWMRYMLKAALPTGSEWALNRTEAVF